jgi:Domain of unknown function (DUF4326)
VWPWPFGTCASATLLARWARPRGTRWGNPFVIGRDGDRAKVVRLYRRWLWRAIQTQTGMGEVVRLLHGRDLCCCCAPAACHGDVLLAAVSYLSQS